MPPRIVEKQSYILDLITTTKMEFQMMPEISDSKSVNWNHINIIGRSHPILGYDSSAPRMITLNLQFFATVGGGGGGGAVGDPMTIHQVKDNLRFLQSLAYPDYSGDVKPPHKCLIKIGNNTKMVGVCQDVTVSYKGPWDIGLCMMGEANITFIEAHNFPIDYAIIRGGGSGNP